MYLFIMEDGSTLKGESFSDEDKAAAEDGYLDIIDCTTMQKYYNGGWHDIEVWQWSVGG